MDSEKDDAGQSTVCQDTNQSDSYYVAFGESVGPPEPCDELQNRDKLQNTSATGCIGGAAGDTAGRDDSITSVSIEETAPPEERRSLSYILALLEYLHDSESLFTYWAKQDALIVKHASEKEAIFLAEKLGELKDLIGSTEFVHTWYAGVLVHKELIEEQGRYEEGKQYERLGLLGSGKFGTVHLMRDKTSKKEFANKCIKWDCFQPMEAIIGISLHHSNIISLLGLIWNGHHINMLFEYHPGTLPLHKIIACGPVDQGKALKWMKPVFEGLNYLHDEGIFHNDIKLDNILVCEQVNEIYIADLGLATKIPPAPKELIQSLIVEPESTLNLGVETESALDLGLGTASLATDEPDFTTPWVLDVTGAISVFKFLISGKTEGRAYISPETDGRLLAFLEHFDDDKPPRTVKWVLDHWPHLEQELEGVYAIELPTDPPQNQSFQEPHVANGTQADNLWAPRGPPSGNYSPPSVDFSGFFSD